VGAGGRALLASLCVAAAGCGGGHESATPPAPGVPASISLSSPALGEHVPRRFTCDGAGQVVPGTVDGANPLDLADGSAFRLRAALNRI